ncbi:hypothetical protein LIER_38262 [Lithospermum erythrorhizon]|uniref:Uncharacterized protein n=1 Tax=Lithospermum erythrorhizon TaxID=34254 RepID=A0AAV3PZD8_LITER
MSYSSSSSKSFGDTDSKKHNIKAQSSKEAHKMSSSSSKSLGNANSKKQNTKTQSSKESTKSKLTLLSGPAPSAARGGKKQVNSI